jgi:hypothetical protein
MGLFKDVEKQNTFPMKFTEVPLDDVKAAL